MLESRQIEAICLGHKSRMTARAMGRLFGVALRNVGIPGSQFTVLIAVDAHGPASLKAIAGRLDMEPSTLSRHVRLMRAQGLLTNDGKPGRRGKTVSLTPLGKENLARAVQAWETVHRELLNVLTPDRAEALHAALNELEQAALTLERRRAPGKGSSE